MCNVAIKITMDSRLTIFPSVPDKVKKKYGNLGPGVLMIQLEKGPQGLGLSLAGHKDRTRMAVFVCGINPRGSAHKTGAIHVGDEILEVCTHVTYHSYVFTSSNSSAHDLTNPHSP